MKNTVKKAVIGTVAALTIVGATATTQARARQEMEKHAARESYAALRASMNLNWSESNSTVYEYGKGLVNVGTDAVDVNENIYVHGGKVNLEQVGTQDVNFVVYGEDRFGSKESKVVTRTYTVVDTNAPIIEFKENTVTITAGDVYHELENIAKVYDIVDGELEYTEDELTNGTYTITKKADTETAGEYTVEVTAQDINGNQTTKTFTLIVEAVVSTPVATAHATVSYADGTASNGIWGLGGQQGSVGRLSIPEVGYAMPLYDTASSGNYQAVVDAPNSALYTNYLGKMMIADHAAQGFSAMKSCYPGMRAYIIQGDTIHTLVCNSYYSDGHNVGDGILINGTYADEMNDGSLFMYTCNDASGYSVTLTFWSYID